MHISKKLREGGIVRSYQNHTYLITSTYIAGKTTILWLCERAQWGTKRVWGTRGRGGHGRCVLGLCVRVTHITRRDVGRVLLLGCLVFHPQPTRLRQPLRRPRYMRVGVKGHSVRTMQVDHDLPLF